MIGFDQIPALRGPRPEGAAPANRSAPRRRTPAGLSRRSLLGAAVASGTALGFSMLGVFPAAKRAYAEGYDIWTGACPPYADPHNCSPGCGPSTVSWESCEQSGTWRGYHKASGSYPVYYELAPDDCTPTQWAEADGWLWTYSGYCAGCYLTTYRCHDGWTHYCPDQCWSYISICRWRTRCN